MSHFMFNPTLITKPVIPINTFTAVSLTKPKPLVLCDIDDTVIGYDHNVDFFYNRLKTYIEKTKLENSGPKHIFKDVLNDTGVMSMTEDEIRSSASEMYEKYRLFNKPNHCDSQGFVKLVKKVKDLGGELQFLTARSRESTFFTRNQFKEIGINYDDYRVNYTGNMISKGEYINRYFNLGNYGEVVFIDDLDSYIQTVVNLCPSIQCYKFLYSPNKEN